MNAHTHFEELLPLYAAGQLDGAQRLEVQEHLTVCAECQSDLEMWEAVSGEIVRSAGAIAAPTGLTERALESIHSPSKLRRAFWQTADLLHAQARLVRSELWLASAVVMAMGTTLALLWKRADIIYFIAPLVAASTLSILYGAEHDPALELTRATPTSPWKILLARLSIVSGYNLMLSLAATLILLSFAPLEVLGGVIIGWLGPLAFLSTLALLLSLWLGTNNAVAIAYALWMAQYIPFKALEQWLTAPAWAAFQVAYQQFWSSPLLLLALSALLIVLALWYVNRTSLRLNSPEF